ncbi:DUF1499 domain-containing protein [Leptospira yasudae]|uniref:DUF1499 domain-containing protein n=1 Tax=Leptospira yasudae TaxID=2202201 RepID=A0ABX9M324_9LEPT|nr:DUF1499 domain-containing protein [Leptospira yasudae]RHX79723.1 DUF1499 domain-containing protein [Leptospira yasudae]RHX95490.1 DUF1499 domain-containing protein [Leptospira yasudae]
METALLILLCCTTLIGPRTGVYDKELNYCSPRPNCVSSQSSSFNFIHHIEPFRYKEEKEEAFQKLKEKLEQADRVSVLEVDGYYIKTRFYTRVFHFPDTVEFLFDENDKIVQIRSESILGLFDFLANRRRMNNLREELGWE